LKAPYHVAIFKDKAPDIPLPFALILTRWGTWIRAAVYYFEHLEIIKHVVEYFNKEDAINIANSQKYFFEASLTANLLFIKSNFVFLPDKITSLEAKNISLSHAIDEEQNINLKLGQVPGPIGKKNERCSEKKYWISKSTSNFKHFKWPRNFNEHENLNINDLVYFKYAPVNSVDVERSFSMFKVLLADNRQSFQFENSKKHFIVQYNFQGKRSISIN